MKIAKDCRASVISALRYRDAYAAIAWLECAFGFKRQAVYEGPNNSIAHAQLVFGNGMVMVSSVQQNSDWSAVMAQPCEVGGRSTAPIILVVQDAALVYVRAKAAGARIFQDLQEMSYGGRAFGCTDPEGHVWSVGEYDPWAEQS